MQRSRVDFPEPDGPRMLTVEPDLTSRDTPPSTSTPSKLLQMSSACRTGAPSDTAKALLLRGSVDRRDQPFDQQGNHPVQGDGDDEGFERHEVPGMYRPEEHTYEIRSLM